jgi:hypothetical protein
VSPNEKTALSDEDEVACAPESGQPAGGRDNPWDDDDEEPAGVHAWPADHHAPPGDDL